MFFSSRVVPHTPPSLVKSSSSARGVMIGADELGSEQRPRAGAEECRGVAGRHRGEGRTRVVARRRHDWHAGQRRGRLPCAAVPARCRARRSPAAAASECRAPRADPSPTFASTASTHCVVVALVYSARSVPDSQRFRTSGIVAKRCAAAIVSGVFLTRRIELIQRVEPQELNPGRGVDPLARTPSRTPAP